MLVDAAVYDSIPEDLPALRARGKLGIIAL
jgi:hypothetical protein